MVLENLKGYHCVPRVSSTFAKGRKEKKEGPKCSWVFKNWKATIHLKIISISNMWYDCAHPILPNYFGIFSFMGKLLDRNPICESWLWCVPGKFFFSLLALIIPDSNKVEGSNFPEPKGPKPWWTRVLHAISLSQLEVSQQSHVPFNLGQRKLGGLYTGSCLSICRTLPHRLLTGVKVSLLLSASKLPPYIAFAWEVTWWAEFKMVDLPDERPFDKACDCCCTRVTKGV